MGALLLDLPAPQVARLTISNPLKRGALDREVLDEFVRLLPTLDARALIIRGEDTMFSAGYDIRDLPEQLLAAEAEELIAHPYTEALEAVENYPYPTIAQLGGHTLGGGLELAVSCDLRYAAPEIALGMPPAKLGLVYSHTGLRKFIDLIGVGRTRELFLTGRRIGPEQAQRWGLVNDVIDDDLDEFVVTLATEIANQTSPISQLGNKRMIRALLNAEGGVHPEEAERLEEIRRACFGSEDFAEGVRAFREKRPPQWRGR